MVRITSGLAARLLLVVTLGALPALGGWTSLSVQGTPSDVQVTGEGTFTVSTSQGAFLFQDGVPVGSARVGTSIVGTYARADGCMCAIDGSTGLLTDTCSAQTQVYDAGALSMRHAQGTGGGYLLHASFGGTAQLRFFPSGVSVATSPSSTLIPAFATDLPVGPMDVEQTPLGPIAAIQVQFGGTSNTTVRYARGATLLNLATVPATGTGRDVDLVPMPNGLHTFVAADNGLYRMDSSDGASSWTPGAQVFVPQAGETVRSVSLDGTGGVGGANGHGMMIVTGGGPDRIFRSEPAFLGQGGPGTHWVETATGLSATVPFAGVECVGAHTCVAWRSSAGPGNLALYRNDAPPVVRLGPLPAPAGEGTPLTLVVEEASDPDDDPVGVQWGVNVVTGAPPLHSPSADGRQLTIDTSGLVVCEPSRRLTVRTMASDGLGSHQVTLENDVDVLRSRSPKIAPSSGTLVPGGAPLTLTASADDFAACAPGAWRWIVSGPGALEPTTGQQTALTVTGPACDPAGGVVSVTVEATGSGGAANSPTATFEVPAWGPPPVPFAGAAARVQMAGTTQRYEAAPHACEATPGFPGQQTRWRLLSPPPSDVRLLDDAGRPLESEATGSGITVAAGRCAIGPVELEVQSELASGAWPATTSSLRVQLEQPVIALADATLSASDVEVVAGQVHGTLSTNIPCPSAEGWTASLQLREGGRPVGAARTVSPDGAFVLPSPELCAGGAFTVEATLLDPSGTPGMVVTVPVTAAPAPVAVGELVPSNLLASCEHGARGEVSLQPPSGACLGATWTWTRKDGPALVDDVLTGRTVTLASAPGLPLDALVGRFITFEVRADAGNGNLEVKDVVVPIGAEVLVDVEVSGEAALVPAEGYSGVVVGVRNRTTCALATLQLRAPLTGFAVAPGPVLVDGAATDLTVSSEGLSVDDLALVANGRTSLELMLRPSLSGRTPVLEAEVRLNGVRISARASGAEPPATSSGCGCSGAGARPGAVLVGILALLLRRRRVGR